MTLKIGEKTIKNGLGYWAEMKCGCGAIGCFDAMTAIGCKKCLVKSGHIGVVNEPDISKTEYHTGADMNDIFELNLEYEEPKQMSKRRGSDDTGDKTTECKRHWGDSQIAKGLGCGFMLLGLFLGVAAVILAYGWAISQVTN